MNNYNYRKLKYTTYKLLIYVFTYFYKNCIKKKKNPLYQLQQNIYKSNLFNYFNYI